MPFANILQLNGRPVAASWSLSPPARLRYQVEDTWPTDDPPPPRVAKEEEVAGAVPQALTR